MTTIFITEDIIRIIAEKKFENPNYTLCNLLKLSNEYRLVTSLEIFRNVSEYFLNNKDYTKKQNIYFLKLFVGNEKKIYIINSESLNDMKTSEKIILTTVYHKIDHLVAGSELDFSPYYGKVIWKTKISRPIEFLM